MGLAAGKGPEFERLAARVAEQLGTSIVLVALLEEASLAGAPVCRVEEGSTQPLALSQLICAEVVSTCATVVVEDVADDPRFAPNAELLEKGIRFFAAVTGAAFAAYSASGGAQDAPYPKGNIEMTVLFPAGTSAPL
jgi:hypothetical protein